MPNTKYAHTSVIMSGSDWTGGRVKAYLLEDAVFDADHTLLADVKAGATQANVTEIQNKSIGPGGAALGVSALFNVTPKGDEYQVVLAWDRGPGVPMPVLAFFDEDGDGGPIALQNNGTLIVRPENFDPATGLGTWFTF